jgi:choline-glycine betaine transporter
MNIWIEAGIFTVSLLAGFAAGWTAGLKAALNMPNIVVSTLILLSGSLGGPYLTYELMGSSILSYSVALFTAGFTTGLVFWPMGEEQGKKQLL